MGIHKLTETNAKVYHLIEVRWVQANWDRREDLAGPRYGLLAKGPGWRVYLCRWAVEEREGAYQLAVKLQGNYMYVNTGGVNAVVHGLLKRLGVVKGTKALVHHITYALEGGSLPNDGVAYDRHHVNGNPFDNRASNIWAVPRLAHQAYNDDHPAAHKHLPEGWTAYLVFERVGSRAGNAMHTVGPAHLMHVFGWRRGRACKAARILAIVASRGNEGIPTAELLAAAKPYKIGPKNAEKLLAMLVSADVPMLHKLRHGRYTLADAGLAGRYRAVTHSSSCNSERIRGP